METLEFGDRIFHVEIEGEVVIVGESCDHYFREHFTKEEAIKKFEEIIRFIKDGSNNNS